MRSPAPIRWAVQWRSKNRLDGKIRYWIWDRGKPLLFRTRDEANAFIKREYGYIAHRQDLRDEPHGWRMPKAVRVRVEYVPVIKDEAGAT